MSTPFKVDIDDIEFMFFDLLGVDSTLGKTEKYGAFDADTYKATLREAAKIAEEVLGPINGPGDRQGCKLDDDGNVTTPDGYVDAWKKFAEGGWIAPSAPPEYGGVGLPRAVTMTVNDMFIGACTAFMMYPGLTAPAGRMVVEFGDDAYKELVATRLFTGQWSGTMCLTESGAGSSVGDNRAKAEPSGEDGVYFLEGEKIFISGGDTDMAENIIHLVLARTPGSPGGTKGLSLFMVPKYEFDAEGNIGARNDAKVVGIEHKMGINGSATCTLALGSTGKCKGWLIGKERGGIMQMFKMMNEARIGVAGQGAAAAGAAYSFARQYANERVQGTTLTKRDADAERVTIAQHPDVRRMLMTLKVVSETVRALCVRIAYWHDLWDVSDDEAEKKRLLRRADLLIPILKAHVTDLGFDMAVTAVQVYGGYGFIGEYPVEQLVRDSKIQSIYEGTNGIQALDLLGRKMRIDGGALFMEWMGEAQKTLGDAGKEGFAAQGRVPGQGPRPARGVGDAPGQGRRRRQYQRRLHLRRPVPQGDRHRDARPRGPRASPRGEAPHRRPRRVHLPQGQAPQPRLLRRPPAPGRRGPRQDGPVQRRELPRRDPLRLTRRERPPWAGARMALHRDCLAWRNCCIWRNQEGGIQRSNALGGVHSVSCLEPQPTGRFLPTASTSACKPTSAEMPADLTRSRSRPSPMGCCSTPKRPRLHTPTTPQR